jgi:hypothetical protein
MSTSSEPWDARLAGTVTGVARWLGVAFFALALVVALGVCQMYMAMAAGAWGPLAPLFCGSALLLCGLAGWSITKRRNPSMLASPKALWLGLALACALRLLVAFWVNGPLVSDFAEYHGLAVAVSLGGPWFSEARPMGYPLMLGALYVPFGPAHWVGVALNVGLALVTGALLYFWVRRLESAEAASLALLLYALCPAQALMVAVQGSEIPYAALVLAAVLAFSWCAWDPRHAVVFAAVGGALLGFSQYVRPTSVALVPATLIFLWLANRPQWRPTARSVAACVGTMLVVLAPVAHWNWQAHHTLSLSTSTFGGWSELVGSNQQSNGFWNKQDLDFIESYPLARRDEVARQEAHRRIKSDPLGFLALVTRKFAYLWGAEDYGTYWTLDVLPGTDKRLTSALYLLSQAWYVLALFFALGACWSYKRLPEPVILVLLGLGTLVGAHSFLEVQSRYHFYWTPLFAALAGIGAARAWTLRQDRKPLRSDSTTRSVDTR